jgi:hypothetical protein
MTTKRIAAITLAVVASAASLTACNTGPSAGTLKYEAADMCHTFVGRQLKSPASADYSNDHVTGGPAVFTVVGDVDADNSFGASIRGRYRCVVSKDAGDNDMWHASVVNLR